LLFNLIPLLGAKIYNCYKFGMILCKADNIFNKP